MSARKKSGRTIDLRKRKAGVSHTRPLRFPKISRRSSPLRARRRRVRVLIAFGIVLVLVLAAYGISWLSYLPQFSIHTVTVVGAKEVSPSLIKTYVETKLSDGRFSFFSRQNIFLYPRAELAENIIEYFPRIRDAEVSRDTFLSQTVVISIEERQLYARWCAGSKCYFLDENGLIFAEVATSTPSDTSIKYTFTGGFATTSPPVGKTLMPEDFSSALVFLERLERSNFLPRVISFESLPAETGEQDFSVTLAQGFTLRASFGSDLEKVVRNLELVISSDALRGNENELEYIDLRFGNRVYYKFKNGEVQTHQ